MDLVEVAPEARPPVVKMMDYGKHRYEAQRASREARKRQHTIKVKEVKFRPGIEDHDYEFKVGHAKRFLGEGHKVKLTMMFRGRQITHPEIGLEVLSRVMDELVELGKVEFDPGKRQFWRLAAIVPDLASEQEAMGNAATQLERLAKREGNLIAGTDFTV